MKLLKLGDNIKSRKSSEWENLGQNFTLKLFHKAALTVPAYRDFLKKNNINSQKIVTFTDLQKVPFTDKKNYIDQYSLKDLSWNGTLPSEHIITTSSGSTGKSYFWPISKSEFDEGALLHEYIYKNNFQIDKYKTLIIVCFGMGTWVAGIYTFLSSYLFSNKNTVGLMTPGFNRNETVRILNEISPLYDQTILAGYPTFIKDLLEQYNNQKKATKKLNIKFLFAGEGFTESWRDYVMDMVGNKNILTDSVNILGSADASLMGFETKASIQIRRWTQSDASLAFKIFKSERIPSLQNYIPSLRFFDTYQNELLLSANRVIPFIRYNIHDIGSILSYDQVKTICHDSGYTLENDNIELPFVYVYGRGKFTTTIYAVNIYPENVRDVLFHKEIRNFITGKFLIETKNTDDHKQYLDLKIELADGIKNTEKLADTIALTFIKVVSKVNREYHRVYQEYGSSVKPKISLYSYQDPQYFSSENIKKTG